MLVLAQHFLAEDGFCLEAEYTGVVAQNIGTEHRHQAYCVLDWRKRRRLSGPLRTVKQDSVVVTCVNCQRDPCFVIRLQVILQS